MYEYFEGYITSITPAYIVMDVNGIGYLLYASDPYHYQVDTENKVRVYIHQVVTDSFQSLYAFNSRNDKALFEKLINVSGIGPKSANAIMAGNQNQALLKAINEENITFLTKFPGVGKKTAKQIVLDLKGKLDDLFSDDLFTPETTSSTAADNAGSAQELKEAMDALTALGYSAREVKKVEKQLVGINESMDTNQYLSEGLKLLTQF